jgi:tRNA A37 threonylcarbamoyladenosine modification protein TsaB
VVLDALPEAMDVIFIAQHHFARGLAVKADALEPSYLRSSVGWKKRELLSGA